jgi:hypothetical protein
VVVSLRRDVNAKAWGKASRHRPSARRFSYPSAPPLRSRGQSVLIRMSRNKSPRAQRYMYFCILSAAECQAASPRFSPGGARMALPRILPIRSSSGPLILAMYRSICGIVQWHSRRGSTSMAAYGCALVVSELGTSCRYVPWEKH